jgi:hypothetical protein
MPPLLLEPILGPPIPNPFIGSEFPPIPGICYLLCLLELLDIPLDVGAVGSVPLMAARL